MCNHVGKMDADACVLVFFFRCTAVSLSCDGLKCQPCAVCMCLGAGWGVGGIKET